MEIIIVLQCLSQCLDKTTLRQLSLIVPALLAMTGRVTMLGISRWTEPGGSYRTIQRFYNRPIVWAKVNWILIRHHLLDPSDTLLIGGDETVVTKAGKETYGLDRFFSSLYGKPVPGLSFFSLSLISVNQRTSYPVMMDQGLKETEEKPAQKSVSKKAKKPAGKKGRPQGSRNKNRREVELKPYLSRIQTMLTKLLVLIGLDLKVSYCVMDGAFGHNYALQMVRQCSLHLISKLRADAALYFPYTGPQKKQGARKKYGQKFDYAHLPMDRSGDGRTDLVSETEKVAQFHLARPELPDKPTWSIDLAALAAEVPKPSHFDLDNLLSNVETQVNWKVADLDGEAPNDLVIQCGGKISVYLGGSVGPRLESPDQVLKASGNVLYFLLRDVNKDSLPDLQLLRGATISIGEVLRLLVVPGSLDFDVFSYNNEGGQFTRKPSVRTTLSLRIPALLGFLGDIKDMQADYKTRRDVPAQPAALDGDGAQDDVIDVAAAEGPADVEGVSKQPGVLCVWKGAVPAGFQNGGLNELKKFSPEELLEQYALNKLDALSDGGTLSIEVKDIQKMLVTPGYDLRQAAASRAPDERWPLPFPAEGAKLRIEDIDGDGRDDVIVMGKDADDRQQVQFFVSR